MQESTEVSLNKLANLDIFRYNIRTMQYAVIETGGKQYIVKKGDVLEVEKLSEAKDNVIMLEKVLLFVDKDKVEIGEPYVAKKKVQATVVDEVKGVKVDIIRYRAKSKYRKAKGHRAVYSKIRIDDFVAA